MIPVYETDEVLDANIKAPARLVTFYGSSEETKPTDGVADGSICIETDTQAIYMFDAAAQEWREWDGGAGAGGSGSSDTQSIQQLEARVTALEQGGGGEQFELVYAETLSADSQSGEWNISLQGTYLDVVVYLNLPSGSLISLVDFQVNGVSSMFSVNTAPNAGNVSFYVINIGGIPFWGMYSIDYYMDAPPFSFLAPDYNMLLNYPGISSFKLECDAEKVWKEGTQVSIYARRPVTAGGGE